MTPPTITPLLVAELLVEGERWPVYVHVIDHPAARVLVDTGMTELHPEVADLDPLWGAKTRSRGFAGRSRSWGRRGVPQVTPSASDEAASRVTSERSPGRHPRPRSRARS